MTNERKNFRSGLTLVEVMIATSIILVFFLALFGTYNMYLRTVFAGSKAIKAAYLAEEGVEAIRFLRDSSWENNIAAVTPGTAYNLAFEAGVWQVSGTPIFVDGLFERSVVLSEVYRDSSSLIVLSGGTLDPGTRKVTVSVAWGSGAATTTKSVSTYITNLFGN